jgi:hypothetical protein
MFDYESYESSIITSIGIERVQGEPVFVIITSKGDKVLTKNELRTLDIGTFTRILLEGPKNNER